MNTTANSSEVENFAIHLPITNQIRQTANDFAARQPTKKKAEQILLNTIAVLIVNNYLSMLEISTDLADSDSWNLVMQLCSDVADLNIPKVGKLECRPIKTSRSSCKIPMEVWQERIGYVVVQIDNNLRKAAILGFTPEVTTEELPIANLRPPEELIDFLHHQVSVADDSRVNLGQWFNNIFEAGWEVVENLLSPEQLTPAYSFRSSEALNLNSTESSTEHVVARAKSIDLEVQIRDDVASSSRHNIVLLIEIFPEESDKVSVTVRVHPHPDDFYLPEALELKVLEASNEVFMQTQARSKDNYIQLQFSGQPEELFQIEITLNEAKFLETFKL